MLTAALVAGLIILLSVEEAVRAARGQEIRAPRTILALNVVIVILLALYVGVITGRIITVVSSL